jgi:hypothetical protein
LLLCKLILLLGCSMARFLLLWVVPLSSYDSPNIWCSPGLGMYPLIVLCMLVFYVSFWLDPCVADPFAGHISYWYSLIPSLNQWWFWLWLVACWFVSVLFWYVSMLLLAGLCLCCFLLVCVCVVACWFVSVLLFARLCLRCCLMGCVLSLFVLVF